MDAHTEWVCLCVKTLRAASPDNIHGHFLLTSPIKEDGEHRNVDLYHSRCRSNTSRRWTLYTSPGRNFVAPALLSQISRMAPLSLQTVQPKRVKCHGSVRWSFPLLLRSNGDDFFYLQDFCLVRAANLPRPSKSFEPSRFFPACHCKLNMSLHVIQTQLAQSRFSCTVR